MKKLYVGNTGSGKSLILEEMEHESRAKLAKNITPREQGKLNAGPLPGLKALYGENTYQCPRCGYPLLLIAEHALVELYECKQCGYMNTCHTKQVTQ